MTNDSATLTDVIPEITVDTVKHMLCNKTNNNFTLIDVRESEEWDDGYILGAIHISKNMIEREIEKHVPNRNTKVVLYCGGGMRSLSSAACLLKMNYNDVSSMTGGIRAWKAMGWPVVED